MAEEISNNLTGVLSDPDVNAAIISVLTAVPSHRFCNLISDRSELPQLKRTPLRPDLDLHRQDLELDLQWQPPPPVRLRDTLQTASNTRTSTPLSKTLSSSSPTNISTIVTAASASSKSEVTDLKLQLRQLAGSRAPGSDDAKRDLFKKVFSFMTIGIDVSSAFSVMVMCSATSDIVLKKMYYLYVGNYAPGNPDLALITINFPQKDCRDEYPMIRGLAPRSLYSLRVANLVEYGRQTRPDFILTNWCT